jgi:hypothetical protein
MLERPTEKHEGDFDLFVERDNLRKMTKVQNIEVLMGGPNTRWAGHVLIQYRRGRIIDPHDHRPGLLREWVFLKSKYNRDFVAEVFGGDKESFAIYPTRESLR